MKHPDSLDTWTLQKFWSKLPYLQWKLIIFISLFIPKYLKAFLRHLVTNIDMWHKNHLYSFGSEWGNHRKTELHYSWQLAIVTRAIHKKSHYPSSAANVLLHSRQVFQHICPNIPIYKIPNVESHVETLKGCQLTGAYGSLAVCT